MILSTIKNIIPIAMLLFCFSCNNDNVPSGDGTILPLFGVQLFAYPDYIQQLNKAVELRVNRIRTSITQENYNKEYFHSFFQESRKRGIAVLVTISNTQDHSKTPELARLVAQNHANQDDIYLYEIENECNDELTPGNLLQPEVYFQIYVQSFNNIRTIRKDTHIFPSGLVGSLKADIPVTTYISRLMDLGIDKYIQDPIRKSAYNIHYYDNNFNTFHTVYNLIKSKSNAKIWVTEFGTSMDQGIESQKRFFDIMMSNATKDGVEQVFYYALAHGGNPTNPADDFSLLDTNLSPRMIFNYIKERK